MDKIKAQELLTVIFELIEICMIYENNYGGGQHGHNSPDEAWSAADVIHDKQVEVAKFFDPEVVKLGPQRIKGLTAFGYFMDSKLASEMAMFAVHIFIHSVEVELGKPSAEAIINQQRILISMLDPKAVRERMKTDEG